MYIISIYHRSGPLSKGSRGTTRQKRASRKIVEKLIRAADAPLAANIAITVLVDAIASGELKVEALLGGERNLRGGLLRLETVRTDRNSLGPEASDPRRYYVKTRVKLS
jgi:hypothetical protein